MGPILVSRRHLLISGFVLAGYPLFSAYAQVGGLATIATLKSVADLLGAAADGLSKLADSIAHIASLSLGGYDEVSARHIRARLKDIDARLVDVHRRLNAGVMSGIEGYIATAEAYNAKKAAAGGRGFLQAKWKEFVSILPMPLEQVQELLDDVKAERSDFILEQTYGEIISTLHSRVDILKNLMMLPPPTTPEEIDALKEVLPQYDRLRKSASEASKAFAKYLKQDG